MERSYGSHPAAAHMQLLDSEYPMGMDTSADGSDDDLMLGSMPVELSELLAWDVLGGGLGSATTQQVPSPPQSAIAVAQPATSIRGGSISDGNSSSGSSGSQSPVISTQRCTGGLSKPCIAAAASAVSALHMSADMCLTASPSPTTSSSSSSSTLCSLSSSATTAVSATTTSTHAQQLHLPGRTVDTVLTAGREAALIIHKNLHCSTCSSQPQLHLLTAAALEKLVGWYRAVVAGMRARATAGSTTTASVMTKAGGSEDGDFSPTVLVQPPLPIAIGSHLLEDTLHAAIVVQVLAHRLRDLKSMIELLARRMGEAPKTDSARNQPYHGRDGNGRQAVVDRHDTRLPETVREKLVARVRQRLLVAWEELSILREGQRGPGESIWLY